MCRRPQLVCRSSSSGLLRRFLSQGRRDRFCRDPGRAAPRVGERTVRSVLQYPCGIEGGGMSEGPHEVEEIEPTAAVAMLDEGAYLLDVREDDEWEAGRAPQAHHIVLGELGKRYTELPT